MARSSFTFRLQRLLDVRVMWEQQAQSELQVRRQQVVNEQHQLVVLEGRELELREEQRQPLQRGGDLDEFHLKRHFLEQSIKENAQGQVQQQGRIAQAEQRVIEQVEVVKQRGIDVKAIEKLRENQREEHRLDQLREEGLFLDDLAGQGFLRRRTLKAQIAVEDAARHAADHEGTHS
ncbi:MAG: flagellar FliJ family protein [Thermoleophilia bacterium]|nr:flagellar FliJ family protein [Thermoleophilia bacterium]